MADFLMTQQDTNTNSIQSMFTVFQRVNPDGIKKEQ